MYSHREPPIPTMFIFIVIGMLIGIFIVAPKPAKETTLNSAESTEEEHQDRPPARGANEPLTKANPKLPEHNLSEQKRYAPGPISFGRKYKRPSPPVNLECNVYGRGGSPEGSIASIHPDQKLAKLLNPADRKLEDNKADKSRNQYRETMSSLQDAVDLRDEHCKRKQAQKVNVPSVRPAEQIRSVVNYADKQTQTSAADKKGRFADMVDSCGKHGGSNGKKRRNAANVDPKKVS